MYSTTLDGSEDRPVYSSGDRGEMGEMGEMGRGSPGLQVQSHSQIDY